MTPGEEAAGLFGPRSMSWKIDREVVVLAGGSCALLMQAAHPSVAAGVAEHSTYATDPVGRLLRTLTSSYDVIFGSRSRAEAAVHRVNTIHAAIQGRVPESGAAYSARDPEALLWVHATLVDTALRVYGRFVAPLSAADEQAYHRECARVAELLGVSSGDMPPTIDELRAWMAWMIETGRVRVTPTAREIARTVLYPSRLVPRVAWDAAHLISLSTLPARLRQQYGIGWSVPRQRGVERIASGVRSVLPVIPGPLRHVPQSRSAERRVRQPVAAVGVG